VEERLANLLSDSPSRRMAPVIGILPWRVTAVVAVNVFPTAGSANRRADADRIDELRRFSRGDAFDEQPMPGLDAEASGFRVVRPGSRLSRRDLETLHLSTRHQGCPVPTVHISQHPHREPCVAALEDLRHCDVVSVIEVTLDNGPLPGPPSVRATPELTWVACVRSGSDGAEAPCYSPAHHQPK
jgi:hypothetical protein